MSFFFSNHPRLPVCRLGLATRGGNNLGVNDIHLALERGVHFLNWCGQPDSLSRAIADLGRKREQVRICVQFEARTAGEAGRELHDILRELQTDYVDVLTFYYVEQDAEWRQIAAADGALAYCQRAKKDGVARMLGLTSHQRRLAAEIAGEGHLDLLMLRYNAAHRGAEQEVFPVTQGLNMPVVVYTLFALGGSVASNAGRSAGLCRAGPTGLVQVCLATFRGDGCSHGAGQSSRVGGGFGRTGCAWTPR